MKVISFQVSLTGHRDCGIILIVYNIPYGIQGPEPPQPQEAIYYHSISLLVLPSGQCPSHKVLKLLKVAWKSWLIFTVEIPNTTSETDMVVWNVIHHKIEMDHNVTGHSYPDPNYQGVTEDSVEQQWPTNPADSCSIPTASGMDRQEGAFPQRLKCLLGVWAFSIEAGASSVCISSFLFPFRLGSTWEFSKPGELYCGGLRCSYLNAGGLAWGEERLPHP